MRMKAGLALVLFLLFCRFGGFAQGADDEGFKRFINDGSDGSSFEQAVVLRDAGDYSRCKSRACLLEVFDEAVIAQELEYASAKYGQRGRDWDISGYDAVEAYIYAQDKYYDDLGVEVFSAGKKAVIHFDITASVHALRGQKYY